MANILVKLTALFILSGMMLHGVVPHHHHEVAGEVNTCCESHEHQQGESQSEAETPCTILSNIHFENFKPQVQVFALQLKHNHMDNCLAMCALIHFADFHQLYTKKPIFIPEALFSESGFYHSFSHRGPPLV